VLYYADGIEYTAGPQSTYFILVESTPGKYRKAFVLNFN